MVDLYEQWIEKAEGRKAFFYRDAEGRLRYAGGPGGGGGTAGGGAAGGAVGGAVVESDGAEKLLGDIGNHVSPIANSIFVDGKRDVEDFTKDEFVSMFPIGGSRAVDTLEVGKQFGFESPQYKLAKNISGLEEQVRTNATNRLREELVAHAPQGLNPIMKGQLEYTNIFAPDIASWAYDLMTGATSWDSFDWSY